MPVESVTGSEFLEKLSAALGYEVKEAPSPVFVDSSGAIIACTSRESVCFNLEAMQDDAALRGIVRSIDDVYAGVIKNVILKPGERLVYLYNIKQEVQINQNTFVPEMGLKVLGVFE